MAEKVTPDQKQQAWLALLGGIVFIGVYVAIFVAALVNEPWFAAVMVVIAALAWWWRKAPGRRSAGPRAGRTKR